MLGVHEVTRFEKQNRIATASYWRHGIREKEETKQIKHCRMESSISHVKQQNHQINQHQVYQYINEPGFSTSSVDVASSHQNISSQHDWNNVSKKNGFIVRKLVSIENRYINNNSSNINQYHNISPILISSKSTRNSSANTENDQQTQDGLETTTDFWLCYAYAFIGFVAIGCYVNGIHGDFVHDDIPAITLNKDVLGTNRITHTFFNDFWGTPMDDAASHKSYRPLTVLSFR